MDSALFECLHMGPRVSKKLRKSKRHISKTLLLQARHLRPRVRLVNLFLIMAGKLCVTLHNPNCIQTVMMGRKRGMADGYRAGYLFIPNWRSWTVEACLLLSLLSVSRLLPGRETHAAHNMQTLSSSVECLGTGTTCS